MGWGGWGRVGFSWVGWGEVGWGVVRWVGGWVGRSVGRGWVDVWSRLGEVGTVI